MDLFWQSKWLMIDTQVLSRDHHDVSGTGYQESVSLRLREFVVGAESLHRTGSVAEVLCNCHSSQED